MLKYFIEVCVDEKLDPDYVEEELNNLVKCENAYPMEINGLEYKFGEVVLAEDEDWPTDDEVQTL